MAGFNLADVFRAVAGAAPGREALVRRGRRLTFADVDERVDAVAAYLAGRGLGCHTERERLDGHDEIAAATAEGAMALSLLTVPPLMHGAAQWAAFHIFAEEVERAVAARPAVRDVVVVGRPSPRWARSVAAGGDGASPAGTES